MVTQRIAFAFLPLIIAATALPAAGRCNHPNDLDTAGRRCGSRAASERSGGRSGGTYNSAPSRSYTAPDYSQGLESSVPGWVILTAEDTQARINIRNSPSVSASAAHYGVVGDRVWASRTTEAEGYVWYFVGFSETQASGWVRGDLIRVP